MKTITLTDEQALVVYNVLQANKQEFEVELATETNQDTIRSFCGHINTLRDIMQLIRTAPREEANQ